MWSLKHYFLLWLVVLVTISGVVVGVSLARGKEIQKRCQLLVEEGEADCIVGLMQVVDNERLSYRARNEAIIFLGELGDNRAVGVLEKYLSETDSRDVDISLDLDQSELRKAIKLLSGGVNISGWIWKKFYGVAI